ncbi:MAG TPA: sigma-70 region 4 domain-containing protein [Solirubrobacteraceae bacterium]
MSRLDELPPDQRAALSLLLRQRKSYAEVAKLLGIAERAVHDRAHGALAMLAPRQARGLPAERREDVGDYLLSQQGNVAARLRTRTYLEGSEPARAWARAIAQQLAPLAGAPLPEIPPAAPGSYDPQPVSALAASSSAAAGARAPSLPSAPIAGSPAGSPPSSRLGGALLLAALVVGVIVAVVLITTSGGSSKKSSTQKTSSTSSKAGPTVSAQLPLHSPNPSSRSVGVVAVLSEKEKRAFYIEAQHLPETRKFFYAIWLYNSSTSAEALSRSPAVGKSHKLAGGSTLPANAAQFREILLTRETNAHPTRPGRVILRGAFSVGH